MPDLSHETAARGARRSEMTSFRLPGDLLAALRQRADENGEPLSDVLRRAVLLVLGKCPTCGQDCKQVPGA